MIVRLPTSSQGVPCQRSDVIATSLLHPDTTAAEWRRQNRVTVVPIALRDDHIGPHRVIAAPLSSAELAKFPNQQ
jgi:hypothetical protein